MKIVDDKIVRAQRGNRINIEDRVVFNPTNDTYEQYGFEVFEEPEPQEGKYYQWEIVESTSELYGGRVVKQIEPVFYDIQEPVEEVE